jgi:hypothetical protein
MKKTYEVELTTTQPITDGEDFWMYRGYITKEEAMSAAEVMSKFFPYYKYATEILVKEYDLIGKSCQNKKIIKRYKLKEETGRVVKSRSS